MYETITVIPLSFLHTFAKNRVLDFWNVCPFFRRGYAKRETTISMGQNMQMCHSLRCKQIDMSTANDLKSISPNNAGGTCTCNRVKTGLKTEGTQCDYDH